MWPIPNIQYEQVCLALNAHTAAIGWVSNSTRNLTLRDYKSVNFNGSFLELTKLLHSFIVANKLQSAFLNVAISCPLIQEQFLRLSTASPTKQELSNPTLKQMIWDYRYLHTLDDGRSLFYLCALARSNLFRFQLLAQQTKLHLLQVTSGYMAVIHAYQILFGPAYRRSQLGVDLISHNYEIEKSISIDNIVRILKINPMLTLDLTQEKISLLTMIGFFNS